MVAGFGRLQFLVACISMSGCYWASPPTTPHGHSPLRAEDLPTLTVLANPVRLRSPRTLVLGRFDSSSVQPIGALYDFHEYSSSPLVRTYYFQHGQLELFEHVCDGLRATGLEILKDYGSTGEPTLLEWHLRQRKPHIIRSSVVSLQHDQVRTDHDPPTDNEVVRLVINVWVVDFRGYERYRSLHTIHGRVPFQEDADTLRLLGLRLAEDLAKDPAFLRAIEADGGGAS